VIDIIKTDDASPAIPQRRSPAFFFTRHVKATAECEGAEWVSLLLLVLLLLSLLWLVIITITIIVIIVIIGKLWLVNFGIDL
jgi:hypothetical protein